MTSFIEQFNKEMRERLNDQELCEIKGLLVDIYGKPNVVFNTSEQVDNFIDDIEKIIVNFIKANNTQLIERIREMIEGLPQVYLTKGQGCGAGAGSEGPYLNYHDILDKLCQKQ